jgi:hypothetical protein
MTNQQRERYHALISRTGITSSSNWLRLNFDIATAGIVRHIVIVYVARSCASSAAMKRRAECTVIGQQPISYS